MDGQFCCISTVADGFSGQLIPKTPSVPTSVCAQTALSLLLTIGSSNLPSLHYFWGIRISAKSYPHSLAPEHPWPAAVHDSWEAFQWLVSEGASRLSINLSKIAIGGSSAGGNLAAIVSQKALALSPPVLFTSQVLSVPVTDNTALVANNKSYALYEQTAALPAEKMLWYRKHYLPNESNWAHPEASPLFYQGDWSQLPPALILVAELDVLRAEGEEYGEKLRAAGVHVDLHVMAGMPHPFLAMDGVLGEGKRAITLMCETLHEAFWKK
jgi:triacylglycerol lipase